MGRHDEPKIHRYLKFRLLRVRVRCCKVNECGRPRRLVGARQDLPPLKRALVPVSLPSSVFLPNYEKQRLGLVSWRVSALINLRFPNKFFKTHWLCEQQILLSHLSFMDESYTSLPTSHLLGSVPVRSDSFLFNLRFIWLILCNLTFFAFSFFDLEANWSSACRNRDRSLSFFLFTFSCSVCLLRKLRKTKGEFSSVVLLREHKN